jgi:protein involved in polysaccharide export with SLBB domain
MKTTRRIVATVLLLAFAFSLSAAQISGLVVRSPLFGIQQAMDDEEDSRDPLAVQSYRQQLGLSEVLVEETADDRVLTAISSGRYPVTPGDTYRLVYIDGLDTVTLDLQADEEMTVAIPGLGIVDGAGLAYNQLKQKILAMVQTYHSYSNPQLVLTGTGSFTIPVIGEIGGTRFVSAWGLSRLSSVVYDVASYASTREVTITHKDGSFETYDLYRAMREGALDQDPLLKSGDVVTIPKARKLVVLSGNVYAPGTFQLLEGDTLQDLVASYGKGILGNADIQRIRIQRYSKEGKGWEVLYADLLSEEPIELQDQDQVIVDSLKPAVTSVVVEGAVSTGEVYDDQSSTALVGNSSGRIIYQFYPGETVRQLFETVSSRLMTVSDLERAYLVRDGNRIPFDIRQVLYTDGENASMQLRAGDTFVIPFNQRFVTVSGAVVRSGIYAYVPDKPVSYYLALAGGLSDDASVPTSIKLYDAENDRIDGDGPVPAEATITVAKNTFVKDIAPTVAVVGLISSILGIVYLVFESLEIADTLF